ncbi:hypothetical protein BCR41DRAFT_351370 [Lobosporangium transversale]|uniref:Uncharacterized protein n=1 Tax=Lobosporangium transversale TaxID=64571 RepID=A0A1Y2GT51_9FUNG|nr:hypothetical protein BCR41DRAFT_351370 [Lobosporangium transversale]ORZ20158.1 hypothetical protein BCR41DRAFT_351370 [Lobosporangium transversale]|eukprot:XP_021882698.1 hypothetical protein BCR41DRAFT_351370 [Lobosporangium transversale]
MRPFSKLGRQDLLKRFGEDCISGADNMICVLSSSEKQDAASEALSIALKPIVQTIGRPDSELGASLYVGVFLAHAAALYEGQVRLGTQFPLQSVHGNGVVDYIIAEATKDALCGIVEVKHTDVRGGVSQNAFQLHAAIMKRIRQEGTQNRTSYTMYGIVTNLADWILVECTVFVGDDSAVERTMFKTQRFPSVFDLDDWEVYSKKVLSFLHWALGNMVSDSIHQVKRIKTHNNNSASNHICAP